MLFWKLTPMSRLQTKDGLLKPQSVIVINNDVLPATSSCHHVVNCPRILDALFPSH